MLICPICHEYRNTLIQMPVTVLKEDNSDGIQQKFTRQGFDSDGDNSSICFQCLRVESEEI